MYARSVWISAAELLNRGKDLKIQDLIKRPRNAKPEARISLSELAGRVLLRRAGAVRAGAADRGTLLGATLGDQGPPPGTWARRLPTRVAGRGPRDGVRPAQGGTGGRGPAGQQMERARAAHVRGGRCPCTGATAPWLAQCQTCAGLAAQSARLRVPAHWRGAGLRGHHRRCVGDPHPHLAHEARNRPARAATDRHRDEMGGRDGLPAGQPGGRCPGAGP